MRRRSVRAVVVALGLGTAVATFAQRVGPQNPPLIITSLAGKDSYELFCASCHGRDGDGRGLSADRLKTRPPDLRLLARRNGGEFPKDRVLAFVTNGDSSTTEHRSSDMLAWGPAFAGLERSEALVKVRIANIVQYVQTLQVK